MADLSVEAPDQRALVIQSLHRLMDLSEKTYLRMGKTLPDVLKEMDRGLADGRVLVGHFTGRADQSASAGRADLVGDVLTDARNAIANSSTFFSTMKESDQASFQSINEGIQNLSFLDDRLKAIREDSVEMELISLNAMTVALKAGVAGRAFSVITEELKSLSTETISYTERLTTEGRQILDLFYQFRRDVERIEKFQEDFYLGFRGRLEGSFDNFRLGVAKMAEILNQVIDAAANTKRPLERIMEEVQSQDIIRQSLQHVVLSLSGVDETLHSSVVTDEELDELVFSAILPDLSCTLLKEVQTDLNRGVQIFHENLSELRKLLESAQKQERASLGYFESGDQALSRIFEESISGMSGLLSSVEKSMADKAKLSPEGSTILESLRGLQESFGDFVTFVDRFRTVDIAARIELAKQEVLRAKRETMGSLTDLSGRIGGDVKAALDIIMQTTDRFETTIRRFGLEVQKGSARVATLIGGIRGVYSRLTEAKDFLSHTMRDFSLYSGRFFTLVEELEAEVSQLAQLQDLIVDAILKLGDLGTQLQAKKQAALEQRNLQSWTIHNDKLNEMIGKFTILSHKQTAAALGGVAVEDGGKPGELTLF